MQTALHLLKWPLQYSSLGPGLLPALALPAFDHLLGEAWPPGETLTQHDSQQVQLMTWQTGGLMRQVHAVLQAGQALAQVLEQLQMHLVQKLHQQRLALLQVPKGTLNEQKALER